MFKALWVAIALSGIGSAVQAQEVYGQLGIPGAGIGYAHGINESFTVRADINTLGRWHHDGHFKRNFPYKGTLKFNQVGAYADWFPFQNGFRVTGGLNIRQAKLQADDDIAHGVNASFGDVTILDWKPGYAAKASVKLPTVAPYIGIGYGHNVATQKPGFTFMADIGVAYGKPKTSLDVNQDLLDTLNALTGGKAQQSVERERAKIQDEVKKYKFMPQVFIGVGYRF